MSSLLKSLTPRAGGCGLSPPSSCRRAQPGQGTRGHCCCSRSWVGASRLNAGNSRRQQPGDGTAHSHPQSPLIPLTWQLQPGNTGVPHLVPRHGEDVAEATPTDVIGHLLCHQEGVLEGRATHSGDVGAGETGGHCRWAHTCLGLSSHQQPPLLPQPCPTNQTNPQELHRLQLVRALRWPSRGSDPNGAKAGSAPTGLC